MRSRTFTGTALRLCPIVDHQTRLALPPHTLFFRTHRIHGPLHLREPFAGHGALFLGTTAFGVLFLIFIIVVHFVVFAWLQQVAHQPLRERPQVQPVSVRGCLCQQCVAVLGTVRRTQSRHQLAQNILLLVVLRRLAHQMANIHFRTRRPNHALPPLQRFSDAVLNFIVLHFVFQSKNRNIFLR
jgi:hypothetical protein